MTKLFDGREEDLSMDDPFVNPDDEVVINICESGQVDARRRLEDLLEERRLREELDDFVDF